MQKEINQALKFEVEKLRKQQRDQQLKHATAGVVGILTGFAIRR